MAYSKERLKQMAEEKAAKKKDLETHLNLEPEFIKTKYGVKVRKACVSCDYRYECSFRRKFFKVTYSPVLHVHPVEDKLHKCSQWKLGLGLENAGLGTGYIRSMKHMLDQLEVFNVNTEKAKRK